MSKLWGLVSEEGQQLAVFIGLSAFMMILASIAHLSNRASFQKYLGKIQPLAGVLAVTALGLILFLCLLLDGHLAIYKGGNISGLLLAIGLALPFAALMILVDMKSPFPADTNVAFPDSVSFYPVMGFIVEILFHLLPFCLVYFTLGFVFGADNQAWIIWTSILLAALVEPTYQVILTSGHNAAWVSAYLGLHLFLTNIAQLLLFKRYDFVSMYSFRLSYYLLWHVVWGHLRLSALF